MDDDRARARAQLNMLVFSGKAAKVVSVAAELSIADHLAGGPKDVASLAADTETFAPSLRRLLRALAALGFVIDGEDGRFSETPLLYWLRADVPGSVRTIAIMVETQPHDRAWNDLLHSIRTGETAIDHAYGMGIFDFYGKEPEPAAVFNQAMTQITAGVAPGVVDAFDFSRFATIVDVGGGHGQLLAAILAATPGARGILFDQPDVVEGAGETLRAAGVADRVEIVGGSFFDSVPAGADAYVMKSILHDWNDEASIRILSNCRTAMDPQGRVIVIDRNMAEHITPDPMNVSGTLMDLNMHALTGGLERTEAEWRSLFDRAGLALVAATPTQNPMSVIEARV